ncbi:MAG TPA: hypothetical protein VGK73_27015 [Polyangiaceae bacterium]
MSQVLGAGRVVGRSLAIALAASELAAQPAADADAVRASVDYVAPPGCGSRAELVTRITRRSERVRIDTEASPRRLRVEIAGDGERFAARLELEQPSGRRSSRTLAASSCDEALEAVALVAALSLDPTAKTAPEAELPQAVPTSTATLPPPAPQLEPAAPPAESAETIHFRASLSLLGSAVWGPAPAALPGVGLSTALGLERDSIFAPALRLTYVHFGRGGFIPDEGVGEASFQLDQGSLELCPLRLGGRRAAVAPCLLATGGRLLATGSGAVEVQRHSRPWWVLGGSVWGVLRPGGALELSLAAWLGIPLIRDTFQFDPAEPAHVVHEVPGVSAGLGLGAGVVFP